MVWLDVGEGRARDEQGEAAFRVVVWPGGASVRRLLGLGPQDFHISLGFRGRDVHGRSKGLASLVAGAPSAASAPLLAAAAHQLLNTAAGREADAAGVESLASASLAAAHAAGDAASEVSALRAVCLLCGRFARHQEGLEHAGQLLEVCPQDEVASRARAFALMALQRYEEAWPALNHLKSLVERLPKGKERDTTEKWLSSATEKCRSKLGSGTGRPLFPGPEDAATVEGDQSFEKEFHTTQSRLKFPSTSHLKNLGAATRDDKLCDPLRQRLFCGGARTVHVEEKIDGANLGISLDSLSQWRMQARSKMVNWKTDNQFAGLEQWLNDHSSTLCEVLERNNDILFGEWCAARHTVKYTRLPGYFLAFDIYDRRQGRFLSRQSFHTRLQRATGPKIPAVPTVCPPRTFNSIAEVEALLNNQSSFADEFLEGVYLRVDEDGPANGAEESYLVDRCKLVRSEFQQAIDDHGTWRGSGRNQLDMELAVSYAEQSYPCALLDVEAGPDAAELPAESHSVTDTTGHPAAPKGKYPSTPHLPFSPGVNPDDSKLADCRHLLQQEVVVTEKLDGGNCCIKGGQVYARTHAKPATHESFSAVKQLVTGFGSILDGIELFGENMQAVHSIEYSNLTSFFYVFAARRQGEWLAWDEVVSLAEDLGLPTAPVVFQGRFDSPEQLQSQLESWAREPSAVGANVTPEGFVVRRLHAWPETRFADCIAKYVRAGHIQTDDTWTRTWKKAQLGTALPARAPKHGRAPSALREKLTNPREKHTVAVPSVGEVELPRNFSFLLDDVAVSSTPTNTAQILAMASMDIALVVTLTEETPLPADWFKGTGVRNMFVPVRNYHPPTVPQVDEIFAAVAEVVSTGKKVMVHCGGGKGRAGTVAGCLMLRFESESLRDALELERASGSMQLRMVQSDDILRDLREARPQSVETERQERFLREFASVLWRRAAEAPEAPHLMGAVSASPSEHEEESLREAKLLDSNEPSNTPEPSQQQGGSSSSSARAKRMERESEKRLKEIQKRAPKYIMMAGLAGSGKSTFCKALEASGAWVRANQDDLGRKGCMELVNKNVPLARQGKTRIAVDRCNLTKDERAEWLDMLGSPPAKEIVCVFFSFSPEQCKQRAAARLDHPTIRSGGGARIIDAQAKQLERPRATEGFGSVEVVESFEQADALLHRYGVSRSDGSRGHGGSAIPACPGDDAVDDVPDDDTASGPGSAEAAAEAVLPADFAEAMLPADFAEWLRTAMTEELGAAEAEALLPALEVILAGAAEDPEALASAAEVLRDSGAIRCAEQLGVHWVTA